MRPAPGFLRATKQDPREKSGSRKRSRHPNATSVRTVVIAVRRAKPGQSLFFHGDNRQGAVRTSVRSARRTGWTCRSQALFALLVSHHSLLLIFRLLGTPRTCKVIRLRGWYMVDSRPCDLQWRWWSCGEISLGVHRLRIPASRRPGPVARLPCSVTLPFALESAVRVPARRRHARCRALLRYRQSAPVHEHVVHAARCAAIDGIGPACFAPRLALMVRCPVSAVRDGQQPPRSGLPVRGRGADGAQESRRATGGERIPVRARAIGFAHTAGGARVLLRTVVYAP